MRRSAGLLTLPALAVSLSIGVATADDLTPSEITSELIGRHIVWWEHGGWQTGHLVLSPSGQAELSLDMPKRGGDIGRWALRDGQLCTTWDQMRYGSEKCYSIRRGPDGQFVTSGGNVFQVREAGA